MSAKAITTAMNTERNDIKIYPERNVDMGTDLRQRPSHSQAEHWRL